MNDARTRLIPPHASSGTLLKASPPEGERGVRDPVDVFDAAPCGIVVSDERGAIVDVNARALRDFGYERDELVGASIEILVPETLRAHHAAARAPFCPGPQHAMGRGRDLAARRKDGTTFPAEIALSAVGDGRIAAFVVDITERRRAEEALARAEGQLRISDKLASLGMLSAGMAHEINNPLAAILGNLDFLATKSHESETETAIGDARHASERILAIVRDMKVFARNESEKSRRIPIDVCSVLESSLRMAKYEIRHHAQVRQDFVPLPRVDGSESRLGQVFVNLLVNAAQSIPEGRASQNEIRVRTRVGSGPSAVIEISDTGCGMSEDVRRHLFEAFFTTKPVGVGTGLGLSICHRIVTGFGGTIEVESEVGKGTLVRVTLPASRQSVGAVSSTGVVVRPRALTSVLVVDDEPAIAEVVRRLLEPECRVTVAMNGRDVIARVASGARFDAILCDLMMPDVSGMDVHASLTQLAPEQAKRMVFVSGGAFTREAQRFVTETDNAIIDKPFTLAELTQAITSVIAS